MPSIDNREKHNLGLTGSIYITLPENGDTITVQVGEEMCRGRVRIRSIVSDPRVSRL